ncbi:hypothetical protein ES288_A03G192300v1 [Gossypium darwinii]|uniref:Reverse transcriptase Ty1/copia-type domain-containing protein n=1 Tax=Gossypium darwinii TaxID=34276 RepID=A0A5D2H895_GOSDA|nr:hypothetical protein ES288_A03G192300v1 [Gossypium darwinii]
MKHEFDMIDLGRMRYFLGLKVLQKTNGIFISQFKYALEVMKRFGMDKSNPVQNPIVPEFKLAKDGGVKVDKTYYNGYMKNPTEMYLQVAKRALRYLKGTTEFGIFYKKGGVEKLVAYIDSYYAGDIEDRKSTSGYAFLLCSGAVSWASKKQPVVSLSPTKAEFIDAASCACQTIWLRRVLEKLGQNHEASTVLCDSSSTIKLSKNPVMHRTKHIDVRFHFLRELTNDESVELVHCGSQDQLANVMTKPLKLNRLLKL